MPPRGPLASLRGALTRTLVRRGIAQRERAPARAESWLRLAAAMATEFGDAHTTLVTLRRGRGDRAGTLAAARSAAERFPQAASAWVQLAEAWLYVFRQPEALAAYERAIAVEERADALMAAGDLYGRGGRFRDAAARYARAFAAGGDPAALLANARALATAGDAAAAEQALMLWATLVPDGAQRVADERARLPRLVAG